MDYEYDTLVKFFSGTSVSVVRKSQDVIYVYISDTVYVEVDDDTGINCHTRRVSGRYGVSINYEWSTDDVVGYVMDEYRKKMKHTA